MIDNTSRRSRVGLAAIAATTGLALQVPLPAHAAALDCGTWSRSTVASGYGILENLDFDRQGNVILSEQTLAGPGGAIKKLSAAGTKSTLVPNVDGPAGIVIEGRTAYFNSGSSALSGVLGLKTGAINALNLDTGAVTKVAGGIVMPNGLERLPNGDFITSRDLGSFTGLTRVKADGSGTTTYAPSLSSTNGMAYDAARQRLYVVSTFNPTTVVSGVDINNPTAPPITATIPGIGPLNAADDITVGPDGDVYVALSVAGQVVRVDPDTGQTCTVATGVLASSSVEFGAGPGWDPNSIYVTSFLGTLTKLTRT